MKALSPGTAMVQVETGGIVNSCSFLVVDEIDDRDREAAAAHQGKKLRAGKDFEAVSYTGGEAGALCKTPGTYTLTLKGLGNYNGETETSETLYEKGTRTKLSSAKIILREGSSDSYIFDPLSPDTEFKPEYDLVMNFKENGTVVQKVLQEGVDYTVSWQALPLRLRSFPRRTIRSRNGSLPAPGPLPENMSA